MVSDRFEGRYSRNFQTLSRDDQLTLSRSRVAVIGLGGLGGGVAELLARTGVGHLVLVDGDCFETSNLNRQLFSQEHLIGVSKADAAVARIRAINSAVTCQGHTTFITKENTAGLISGCDLVVDCLDTIDARFVLEAGAKAAGIPLVSGAIAGVAGQVTVIFPADPGFERIYSAKSRSAARGVETRTGNLSFCASLVASVQASETIKVLTGRGRPLRNALLVIDMDQNCFETVDLM